MYAPGEHPMYPYSMEERQWIIKESGLVEKQLMADVDTVCDWYSKQPHLPDGYLYRHMIELMIVAAKGSLEKVKRRLDCYYKYRRQAPEILQTRIEALKDPDFKLSKTYLQAPLPKLYKGKRITITMFTDPDSSSLNTQQVLINTLMLGDIRCVNDYMIGDIWIVDLINCSLGHAMRMNPVLVHKAVKIVQDGTGLRISGIHIINCGMVTIMQFLLNMLKQILSEKLFGRIQFHNSYESLYEVVPKEYLPESYGGSLENLTVIRDRYEKLMHNEQTRKFLIDACNLISDESMRNKSNQDEDLTGTFKKLDLD